MGTDNDPLPLSVAIITLNEEANLERTLSSLGSLPAEIIVVDSGSTDRTVEIAQHFGARVLQRDWPGYVEQKNRALAASNQPWVLALDADEPLSPELANSIREAFADGDPNVAGFILNRRTWYLGDWLWHAWYPEWRLRLVRKELAQWKERQPPHDYLAVNGPTRRLQGDLLHYSYQGIEDHFKRTIQYARIAAEARIRTGQRFRWHKLLLSPWLRFFKSLIVKQAWRDGWRGWVVAYSSMLTGILKSAFMLEHECSARNNKRQSDDR